MALAQKDKKFKQFERSIARDTVLGYVRESSFFARLDEAARCTRWIHIDERRVWSQTEIHHAVYEVDDCLEWQTFRIALKGMSTKEKLLVLERRWDALVGLGTEEYDAIEHCRIDNYINALLRGGQLVITGDVAGPLNGLI